MTKIINFYGGPGTGKSTSAAYIFYKLKAMNKNAELVREYVKEWAWEKRQIKKYDQMYFLGKQIRRESMLYGKVDYIVTDCPVYMNTFYAEKMDPTFLTAGVVEATKSFYKLAEQDNHVHKHIFLNRVKPFNPEGRYQTEDEAKIIDIEMKNMLDRFHIPYVICDSDEKSLDNLMESLL